MGRGRLASPLHLQLRTRPARLCSRSAGTNRSNPLSSQRTPPTPARATPLRTLLRLVLRTQSRSGGIAAPHRPSEHSIVKREDVTRMVQSRFFRPSLPSPFRVFRVFRGQIWIGVGSCRVAVILGA
jgi:hypothetical protein